MKPTRVRMWLAMLSQRAMNSEAASGAAAFLAVALFVVLASRYLIADFGEFIDGVVVEATGFLLDVGLFGILFVLLRKRWDRETRVRGYIDELEDYRGWEAEEGVRRSLGIVRRLVREGVREGFPSGVVLRGVDLERDDLRDVVLHRASLVDANLSDAKLADSDFSGSDFENAVLAGADLARAQLNRCCFRFADLNSAKLQETGLRGADLSWLEAQWANFENAQLRSADLRNAFLGYAKMRGANLYNANLQGTDLRGADLRDADLRQAILTGSIATDAESSLCTQWPSGFDPHSHGVVVVSPYSVPHGSGALAVAAATQVPREEWRERRAAAIELMSRSPGKFDVVDE